MLFRFHRGKSDQMSEPAFRVSTKAPLNCRSLGFPGFPVETGGFGRLYVVLFRENHISGTGESGEVGNPGTLGMTRKGQRFRREWLLDRGVFLLWRTRFRLSTENH
jgi:hypothetical protein